MSSGSHRQLRPGFSERSLQPRHTYPLRVLLYSHDSVGLGHLRRNLAITGEIARIFPGASSLIVTGSPCATQFKVPSNTDLIKIPSITKDDRGRYVARNFAGSLENTLALRSKMILEAYRSYKPQLVIMDHQLTGLNGEALDMLREAKANGSRIVYGLRDIKDSPDVIKNRWDNAAGRWALNQLYDCICIYGMQEIFDPRSAYAPLLDRVKKCEFTGFVVPPARMPHTKRLSGAKREVLVTFGGGGDGVARAEKYLEMLEKLPVDWDSHVITGPLMATDAVRRIRSRAHKIQPIHSVRVHRFHGNIPGLLNRVDAVVSMAGYNSCAEILQSGVPAVLLPRLFPRREQLIRATRMAEMGWVTTLPAADPDPHDLFEAVQSALASGRRKYRRKPDLNGLHRLGEIITEELRAAGHIENVPQSAQPSGARSR